MSEIKEQTHLGIHRMNTKIHPLERQWIISQCEYFFFKEINLSPVQCEKEYRHCPILS